jgi:predicted Zn-dependent protease
MDNFILNRRSFLLATPLVISGCISSKKSQAEQIMDTSSEELLAREALPEIRKNYPALQDEKIQVYISKLGQKIINSSNLTQNNYKYTFTVVDVPTVNAFALPAGRVFITAPLLRLVETESELAGVLGHEIGHVEFHHAAKRIQKLKSSKSESWLYGAGGAIAGGLLGGFLAQAICPQSTETFCKSSITNLAALSGFKGGLLVQKYKVLANSQDNELEADKKGFELAVNAGFSPNHVGDFYNRLQNMFELKIKNHEEFAEFNFR